MFVSIASRRKRADGPLSRFPRGPRSTLIDGTIHLSDEPAPGARHLAVVGGLDAGLTFAWPEGRDRVAIGHSPGNDVMVDSGTVSDRHAELAIAGGELHVTDLSSRNGTQVAGRTLRQTGPLGPGDTIRVGAVALEVRDGPAPLPRRPGNHDDADDRFGRAAAPFNRPPRTAQLPLPSPLDPLERRAGPPGGGSGLSVAMVLGPVAFGTVMAVLFSPLMAVFALMGPAMLLASWLERRIREARGSRRSGEARHRDLVSFEQAARAHHAAELAARRQRHPDPATLRSWGDGRSRLWERRAHHDDAYELAIGLAHTTWSPIAIDDAPVDPLVESVIAAIGRLPDAPVAASVGPGHAIGIVGDAAAREAVARWLVLQVATLHGPADVTMRTLCVGDAVDPGWSFVTTLPHGRAAPSPDGAAELVIVVDRATNRLVEPLARMIDDDPATPAGARRGAIVVADAVAQLPSWCTTVIELIGDDGLAEVRTPATGGVVEHVLATGVSPDLADEWASVLGRHRDPDASGSSGSLPAHVPLTQLAGPVSPSSVVQAWHRSRLAEAGLAAPLGLRGPAASADAPPFMLDLVADGPHALIGGTTGSGKSELLRTLVLSLALHHPPDVVSFLLVDYKGGSAFDACADLPHTVGLVTDLEPHLATRALTALDAEIRRREQVLRDAGAPDVASGRVPLTRLLVVIDEFATLAADLPGFLDALVDVAQRGRSLGVHLVLATQRPHGVVNDRIRTNTNLRVALRMLDRGESVDVIDDPAASRLPRDRPGRAIARLGPDEVVPFQTAFTEPQHLRAAVDDVIEAADRLGLPRPRSPWLPPLPASLRLDELDQLDRHGRCDSRGDGHDGFDGFGVSLGLADEPQHQRQRPWCWYPARGNLLVYGMPGSGTTTTLVTVGRAMAGRLPPEDVHLFGVADAGGHLGVLASLPHTGTIVAADDVRRQRRLVRMLGDELDHRRAIGDADDAPPPARIVVLIDDFPGMLRRLGSLEDHPVVDNLHQLFRDGPAAAIHLAVVGDRPGSIPAPLASRTTERVVLHLADPFDRSALGLRPEPTFAAGRPPPPGRGVIGRGAGIEVQIAWSPNPPAPLAAIAGGSDGADSIGPSRRPVPVGELPTSVSVDDLPAAETGPVGSRRAALVLPLGIGDHRLRPCGLVLGAGEHALVVGPPRSGRSTTLGVVARSVGRAVDQGEIGRATVVALVRRPSPLRDRHDLVVVSCVTDLLLVVARSGDGLTLVLVDDADQVDDPTGALAELTTCCRPGLHLVVAGRADRLRNAYGHWSSSLRSSGRGLALRPDVDRDGDLWGVRLPHDVESRRCDGRGFLLTDGAVELVQVACPAEAAG